MEQRTVWNLFLVWAGRVVAIDRTRAMIEYDKYNILEELPLLLFARPEGEQEIRNKYC